MTIEGKSVRGEQDMDESVQDEEEDKYQEWLKKPACRFEGMTKVGNIRSVTTESTRESVLKKRLSSTIKQKE